ncbi:ImmA/IrrE family metallo-endopeptidase [Bacillus sp. RB3]|uniref:ImmA/IrrE family metallo-endopeptidase n=1 Tax=Bacillus sp. RB3 TaxID=3050012 RepID=UPI00254128E7|nr:ImmA/IrrE family metallo-endopeptidase [Bacillus sp. RB3]MDK3015110.1 ImmA/IrrE family metallo-endopeptidase [Bacillus sp. RB3]
MANSFLRVKKLANRIINKYSLSPPINIRELLENYANCVEDSLPNNTDAICIMNIDRPLVILDRFKSDNRKRFTLAHELGHLIIPWHSGMISCHTDKNDDVDGDSYQLMEAEANKFAAEILMPSEWLEEMVTKHEKKGFTELLEQISQGAEVSLSAAFFSVIDHLPSCYIFYIENDDWHFGSFRRAKGTNIAIPTQNSEYDTDWLDNCAIDKGIFDFDSINVNWWKLPGSLSEEDLQEIIEDEGQSNFDEICKKINSFGKGFFAATFANLVPLLPQGYVVEVSKGDYNRLFKAPSTNIAPPHYTKLVDTIRWFKENSYKSGHFKYNGYYYIWGHFIVEIPSIAQVIDQRLSKDILKKILNDCYDSQSLRDKYSRKINGMIGALNNKNLTDFDEFYKQFKMRFLGEEILKDVIQHSDFEAFVTNKTKELIAKKSKK